MVEPIKYVEIPQDQGGFIYLNFNTISKDGGFTMIWKKSKVENPPFEEAGTSEFLASFFTLFCFTVFKLKKEKCCLVKLHLQQLLR